MAKRKQSIVINSILVPIICAFTLALFPPNETRAEGFAMTEWSARGMGLAGGMVARANDVSALAYNAAGITQIPGTSFMTGGATVTPYGQLKGTRPDGSSITNKTSVVSWMPAHGYISHQLNDNVWLGFALYSRFGLGNGYDENWFGRFNSYQIGLLSASAVPTVAYKFNDIFSASLGIEIMYMMMNQKSKIPDFTGGLAAYRENDLALEGSGLGVGLHLGLHARFNEQWSAGLTYKSQVTQSITGEATFNYQGNNPLLNMNMRDSDISGVIQLPDSISFAVAYSPIEDLSIEVGTVWTRWSTYNSLNIYFDDPSGFRSLSNKQWKDGWNFNASVEYKALDWLTLRAGYWHETAVTNDRFVDFGLPINGRDGLSLGLGFNWDAWVLDIAYAHIWIYPEDYSSSEASGMPGTTGLPLPGAPGAMSTADSQNMHTDIFVISLSYTF